ncbi:unnamed protein product [Blepharisma stoltei]|uniref:Uncharacterized protein n=1 Tax=Blepharisma stoltei TaxID=1481888 RepID=A0AAU9JI67_9CILI|nr:unnamed protein product [Blepharisma stoltei]
MPPCFSDQSYLFIRREFSLYWSRSFSRISLPRLQQSRWVESLIHRLVIVCHESTCQLDVLSQPFAISEKTQEKRSIATRNEVKYHDLKKPDQ